MQGLGRFPGEPALRGFALMLLGGLVLGEHYPFSRAPMYAELGAARQSAVLVFLANGARAQPSEFARYRGLDAARLDPTPHLAVTCIYLVDELREELRQHSAGPREAPGPVQIEVGYDVHEIDSDGALHRRRVVVQRGTAWPR